MFVIYVVYSSRPSTHVKHAAYDEATLKVIREARSGSIYTGTKTCRSPSHDTSRLRLVRYEKAMNEQHY